MYGKGLAMSRLRIALGVIALGALPAAMAQVFTLQEAVTFALAHNSSAQVARARLAAAEDQLTLARDQGGPQASVSYGYLLSNNPLEALSAELERRQVTAQAFSPNTLNHPGVTRLGTTTLSLSWPVYQGGAVQDGIKASLFDKKAALHGKEEVRQEIIANVARAYEGVLAALAVEQIAQKGVDAAARHARTAHYLYSHGRIVHSDALTATVNLGANQNQLAEAQQDVTTARNNLALAMGAPPHLAVTTLKLVRAPIPMPTQDLTHYLSTALQKRIDMKALEARIAALRARAHGAQARSSFQVRLMADSQWFSKTPGLKHNAWTIGAVISKSLYDGHQNRDHAQVLEDQRAELEGERAGLRLHIEYQVKDAYEKMQDAAARYAIARTNVTRAKRAVALIRLRYGEGRTILLDLLNAEQGLVQARETRLAALYALVKSKLALTQACGTLSQASLASLGLPS